jgi:hypothetical protein
MRTRHSAEAVTSPSIRADLPIKRTIMPLTERTVMPTDEQPTGCLCKADESVARHPGAAYRPVP